MFRRIARRTFRPKRIRRRGPQLRILAIPKYKRRDPDFEDSKFPTYELAGTVAGI